MGAVTKEKGVLKLVHPGKYLEIHRQPITAAEVMEKNPRHCITRPDVFEYPWIGRVYFIVPHHTIHHLLRTKGSGLPDVHSKCIQSRLLRSMTWKASLHEQDCRKRFREQTRVESFWPEYKDTNFEKFGETTIITAKSQKEEHGDIEYEHKKQVTKLKSCIKKERSVGKSSHLRVSFALQIKDEKLKKRVTESDT